MAQVTPLTDYRLTDHALIEMARREVSTDEIQQVLSAPEQKHHVRPGRVVFQARVQRGEPAHAYLLRVFVDIDRAPPEVVTVYRTSKIDKYWRTEQ